MQPVLVNPKQEFLEAEKSSIRIIERAGQRIGYIHIYSYAGYEYHEALLNALMWGKLKRADALFLAVQSCLIDGVNLEGTGVSPDVEVPFDVRYCAGHDAQLEKALEYLVGQQMKKNSGGEHEEE